MILICRIYSSLKCNCVSDLCLHYGNVAFPLILCVCSSFYLSVRRVPPSPGWGASFPHVVSRVLHGLVWGGPVGGVHHRVSVGPGPAHLGKILSRLCFWICIIWLTTRGSKIIVRGDNRRTKSEKGATPFCNLNTYSSAYLQLCSAYLAQFKQEGSIKDFNPDLHLSPFYQSQRGKNWN